MSDSFAWFELMTTDPAAAKRFYTGLVGWGLQDFEAPAGAQVGGEPYVMWTRGGQPIGGVMRLPEEAKKMGAPPHWLAYVGVADIAATLAKATGLGARVYVPPTDIPGGGRFGVFADPQGAAIGLVQGSDAQQPREPTTPQLGDVSWHELATTDLDAAITFYQALFAWEKLEAHDMGPMGIYQEYGFGGRSLGGMFTKPAQIPGPPYWLLYFRVANVDKASEAAKAQGATIMHGPADVPGGDRIANLMDPQGVAFALHQKNA